MSITRRAALVLWSLEAAGLSLNVGGSIMSAVSFQASSSAMRILSMPHPVVDIRPGHEGKIVSLCANDHVLLQSDRNTVLLGSSEKCDEKEGAYSVSVITSDHPTMAKWAAFLTAAGFVAQALACLGALYEIFVNKPRALQ